MIQKFWIVWNENKEKCDFPTMKHLTKESANIEAERLARIHRREIFVVMELVGSVKASDVIWEFTEVSKEEL